MPNDGNQKAAGSYIAQASGGSTATVTVYQSAAPVEIDEAILAEAETLLDSLPLECLPAPSGLPPKSRMPLLRNRSFVGREADLKALAAALKAGGTAAVGQVPAVTGLGGLGKSQLASEFAYRYGQFFAGGVFWLGFADPEAIASELAACGGPRYLNLHPGYEELPLADQVGRVASAWHSDLPRLLVFDNCEEEDLLEAWLPRGGSCRVIVTSRRSSWSAELGMQAIPLGLLDRSESIALLREHRPDLAEDDADLDVIAETLGDLPLALHLAGSFLEKYCHADLGDPARYLEALRAPDLLNHASLKIGGRSPTRHEQHVANTFALSYDQLDGADQTDQLALAGLTCAACFAPGEPIPRDLLILSIRVSNDDNRTTLRAKSTLVHLKLKIRWALGISKLKSPKEDIDVSQRTEDALARLSHLGLLNIGEEGTLLLHRLLATFVKHTVDNIPLAREAVERAVNVEADRLIDAGYPAPLLAWQPQFRAVTEAAVSEASDYASGLLQNLGLHLRMIADLRGANSAFERALEISEAKYGPDHPDVAICVNNLGLSLDDLGQFRDAETAFRRAIAIDESHYGANHPRVANYVNKLGRALLHQGDTVGAKAAFERALGIIEAEYRSDHPEVANNLNDLATVLRDQGNLAGAKAAYKRAIQIVEASYGPNHPHLGDCVNNLGLVLWKQGELASAKAAFERALRISEASYGPDHPKAAIVVNNLGLVLENQGNLNDAHVAFDRALDIFEATFGPNHPNAASAARNLFRVKGSILNQIFQ